MIYFLFNDTGQVTSLSKMYVGVGKNKEFKYERGRSLPERLESEEEAQVRIHAGRGALRRDEEGAPSHQGFCCSLWVV